MAVDSPSSFTTAREGDTAFLTPPSTTQASRSSPAPPSNVPQPRYRSAAQLTYELAHHCSVYLESGQYLQGFSLLTSLLKSGTLSAPSHRLPAQIPPTQLFELSATLAVYPTITTKASSPDKVQAADAAVRYLRDVNRAIGPVNAGFANAFIFTGSGSSRSRNGRNRGTLGSPTNAGRVEDERPIKSAPANKSGLWAQADDFWCVLGWAFNCSVKHKARWQRWKIWLDLMLEIMEDDWKERSRCHEQELEQDGVTGDELLVQSIIAQYLISTNASSRGTRRRILRAILADGSSKSANEFSEVFKGELKERKKEEDIKPIKEMKLEENDFGDLGFDPDEDEDMDEAQTGNNSGLPTRRSSRNTSARRASIVSLGSGSEGDDNDESLSPTDRLGGLDSVRVRQRILAFLVIVAERLPNHFTARDQLLDSYTEHLRPLPAPIFATLIHTSVLPIAAQCVLAANTLLPLLPNAPPTYNLTPPSQDEWEEYFLPYAANTHGFTDNAKVSILLQHVLQIMLPEFKWSNTWVEAVLKGIRARRKKARGKNKAGGGGLRPDEVVAEKVFKESEQFLLILVQWVEDGESQVSLTEVVC
ncbi:hypothetical protein GTA08_BOTSDO03120 [Neofusicoccum parvum]|uniref:Uncharacterized protein n=1 Tax=Neofusicoccum parvum TaxID=310453 RepID=A0ACB5SFQ0_9PEZI|nr:hypothetical protein GTA08_BOTSDO03120 [Neofusicoccum parvum]